MGIESTNGVLEVSLTLEVATFSGPTTTADTRVLGGSFPGPSLVLMPGETLKIAFRNDVHGTPDMAWWEVVRAIFYSVGASALCCGSCGCLGLLFLRTKSWASYLRLFLLSLSPVFCCVAGIALLTSGALTNENAYPHDADVTNLHFHGAFASPNSPGDNVLVAVPAGGTHDYELEFPEEHMPGTLWIHPHHHGSSGLHTGGGAACAVILKDPPGTLSDALENMSDIVWVVQDFNGNDLEELAGIMGDTVFTTSSTSRTWLVNGLTEPVISMETGVWQRWRLIHAGWGGDDLSVSMQSCEMVLLAKDGIYISDFPRVISGTSIPAGGRADIVVRCGSAGTFDVQGPGGVLARATVVEGGPADSVLSSWAPTVPSYLEDLREETVDSACNCATKVSGKGINGYTFDPDREIHGSKLGSVMQREVSSGRHPYHQHVFPFQVTSVAETEYVKIGDWHDVLKGGFTMRFAPQKFTGKMMMHCHILEHEDQGAMGLETIGESTGTCFCGDESVVNTEYIIVGSVLGGLFCCYLCVGLVFAVNLDKRRNRVDDFATKPLPDKVGQSPEEEPCTS